MEPSDTTLTGCPDSPARQGGAEAPPRRRRGLIDRLQVWLNARRNRIELARGRIVLRSLPQIVFIETGNICNLRCPLCPSGQGRIPPPRGRMTMEVFRPVIEALGPTARQIHLYNWGEPLLNPDIVDMASHAARFVARTYLASNLNVLRPGQAEGLVRSGLDILSVSIDGTTQETYSIYRQGGRLEQVLANVREVMDARRRHRGSRLRVRWQFLVHRGNQSQIEPARRMARELGMEFKTHRLCLGLDQFDERSMQEAAKDNADWLPEEAGLNRYKTAKDNVVCSQLWDHVAVNVDGSIAPCCRIYKPQQWFCQGFPPDFRSFWNGPEYVAARRMFVTGHADREAAVLVCQRCRHFGNVL